MKNSMWVLIVGIIFISTCGLFGQQQKKSINLENNATIQEITGTNNYIAIRAGRQEPNMKYKAYLLDKSGNKLFEKEDEDSRCIVQADVSEPLNIFFVMQQGFEGYGGEPGKDDIIKAYDINTGNEIWKSYMNALRYSISPDGKYMLAQTEELMPRPSGNNFSIINLKTGQVVQNALNINSWCAEWLDNNRIAIAIQQVKRNTSIMPFDELQEKERDKRIDSLVQLRMKSSMSFKFHKTSKLEYEKQTTDITNEIDKLYKQKREGIRHHKPRYQAYIADGLKLIIYNIQTQKREVEKNIYASDGEPIVLNTTSQQGLGNISVEKASQSIYMHVQKGSSDYTSNCLVKLNNSFDVSMITIVGMAQLIKHQVGDELYFSVNKAGKKYVIDKTTGNLVLSGIINTKSGSITLEDQLTNQAMPIRTYLRDLNIQQKNNAIEINTRKEAQQ